MHTKKIAGNKFLCLGKESYNLKFLVSVHLWIREKEERKLPVIILSFGSDTVYLSQLGDEGHSSNSRYYQHKLQALKKLLS